MSTYYKNSNDGMLRILLLSFATMLFLSVFVLPAMAADESSVTVTDAQLMDLNVPFIASAGQQPADVKFYADTFYGRVFVTTVDLTHAVEAITDDGIRGVALKEQFVSADGTAISFVPIGEDPADTKVSYFIGNDSSQWQTDLPTYSLVSLGEIWSGITVKVKANGATIEKLFTVAPCALPDVISVKVQGAERLRIADDGSLVIVTRDGEVSMTAPKAYQDGQEVPVTYRVLDERTYGFTVGEYNRTKILVIDPSLVYSTYLGGSDRDYGYGIATGTDGSAYVAGYAYSTDFPTTTGAYQTTYGAGTSDAFVTRLNPEGSGIAYSTYLGGSLVDQVYGIAVDSSGNAYIAGYTTSSDFPTTEGAYSRTLSGSQDGIVVRLNPSGTSLLYSTYLGGATVVYSSQGQEEIDGITVDSSGKIFVTGRTGASDFPVTTGAYNTTMPHTTGGSLFGFISVINPAGGGTGDLAYSTYLGGDMGTHYSRAIVLDSLGIIYVAGQTTSDIFPVTSGAFQTTKPFAGDHYNGFVSKLNPIGSGSGDLVYSTYIGGTDGDTYARGIGVDSSGRMNIAGYTASTNLPTTAGAYQTTNAGGNDAFVCTMNPAGSGTGDLVYSTYFGGTGTDYGYGSALDSSGTVYLTGSTFSADFPTTTGTYQASLSGTRDAFVAKLNPAGSGTGDLVYSTYFGGTGTDVGYAIALDSDDNAYVTGSTASTDFPVTTAASQATYGGGSYDAFVVKLPLASAPVPPVAAFISDVQTGTAPLTVNFTDQSTNTPTSWAWDFNNDGSVDSTEQNPSHIYAAAGTYTVKLTVTGPGGSDDETKIGFITASEVTPAPVAAFSGTPLSGNAPLTVQFTDASTGSITGYAWDFDNDGSVDSTEQNPSHIYSTAGTYTVNLTVTNAGGSDSEVKTDYITVTAAGPKTWYVDDSGGADFTTIQAAVTAAGAGDTIIVKDGTYTEYVVIDNYIVPGTSSSGARDRANLTIRSEHGAGAVTIDVNGNNKDIIKTTAAGTTIDGFTLNGNADLVKAGIYVQTTTRVGPFTIINNTCNNVSSGISVTGAGSSGSTIANNVITLNGLMATSQGKFTYGAGIWLRNTGNNAVTNNIVSVNNPMAGIQAGTYLETTSTTSLCSGNIISGNTIDGVASGTYIYGASGNQIFENTITNSRNNAINLQGESSYLVQNNVFYRNNFVNNAKNLEYDSSIVLTNYWNSQSPMAYTYNSAPNNGYMGNYWGSYSGADADGNGIGDTPYQTRVIPDEFDNYPLVGAWNNGEITYTPPAVIAPVAAFTSDVQTGTAPLTVNFTDQSTNTPTSWAWDINNDGTVDSTDQSPSHVYDTAGIYTVNLRVTNAAGSDSEVMTDYITVTEPVSTLLWGPYLTGTTTTGTVVNAKTTTATTVTVEYATDAYYTANSAYDQSATDSVSTQLHHVSLASLTPDTTYHYRVVYGGQATGDLHFSTFPVSGPFTFVVYSDTQDQLPTFSQLERHKLIADRIAEEPDVAFVLNSGDLVNDAANLSDWDRYFAAGSMMMANTTVYPALGNHDDNDPNYLAAYGVPEYYSFDCGDGHVAVLDSNDWAWPGLPTQSAWLVNDLQTEKPFKFVSFHHPLYTSEAKHFGGWENLREAWEGDFNENGVLAVFNGHVHAYERFLVNDTNYFEAGIGGGPSYNLATPRYTGSQNSLEYMIGYIRVTVDPAAGTATAQVIRVADVSTDLKTLTTVYPAGTVFETVVMSLPEPAGAPIADFTADVTSGDTPLTVQFTDQSMGEGITDWAWDFDNDGTVDSTGQSPSHIYDIAGTYTVNLTVTNAGGSDNEVKTDYITVSEALLLPVLNINTAVRYATIQGAVTAANAGNTILVGDGSYNESVVVTNGKAGLTIRSEHGAAVTTVTAPFAPPYTGFRVEADSVTIEGFSVRAAGDSTFGISYSSSADSGRILRNNVSGCYMGIVVTEGSDNIVAENEVSGCSQDGIRIDGAATNTMVSDNYCHGNSKQGIAVRNSATGNYISKNILESNTENGICIKDTAANNLLWLNDLISNGVEILTVNTANSTTPITYIYNGGTYTSFLGNYYSAYVGTDADGNGVGDTAFTSGSFTDDYPLMAQSAKYVETTLPAPLAAFIADIQYGTAPLTVQFTDQSMGDGITDWTWDFTNDGTVDSNEQNPSHVYDTPGTYSVKLTVTNAAGSDSEVKTGFITATEPAQLRVLNVNTGVRYATIQAAVNAATAGDTLVVSDGAFTENVDVDKQLTIHSENGASAVTVTAALPTLPVFDVNANGVIIQGFTVRGPTDTHVAGIEIVGFNDCLIVGNDCSGCYNGIHIGGTGTNNTVTENYCHGNTQRGISIRDTAHDNYILKNTVESNTDSGICIKDTTAANVLWLNNVIGNRVEILTENIAHSPNPITYTYDGGTYTSYLGNYYFDYSGADTDGNGVGTPAYSYGTYGDGYPLMGQSANYVETTLIVPTAVFIADVTSGTAPLTVQFTDASTGTPTSWAWDFENDGTVDSTAQSPSHTYSTVSTYTVKLTVTNTAGSDSEVKTGYIGVSSPSSGTALLIQPEAPSVILGGTRTVNIVLSEAADGLAGYNITITLADGTKAEITGASFPGWASVNQQGSIPGDTVWIKALDLNKQVEAGATEVVLATITIRGDKLGTTAITAKATVMDDDDGTAIDPAAAASSLSVIRQVPQLPGYPAPTDPNSDGMYEDLNGNGRMDFNDVVLFFNSMEWISVQDGFGYFDFNRNGRIDFDDVVRLFWGV